jgi:hypothetical protein
MGNTGDARLHYSVHVSQRTDSTRIRRPTAPIVQNAITSDQQKNAPPIAK